MDNFAAEKATPITENITIKAVLWFFTGIIGKAHLPAFIYAATPIKSFIKCGWKDRAKKWRMLLLKLSIKVKVNN